MGHRNNLSAKNQIDFIGIGAGKSGTTWLADNLQKHPRIYIPAIKELRFFNMYKGESEQVKNPNYNKSLQWYHKYFRNARDGQVKGEITPAYMKNENSSRDIFSYNPKIKIIVILRDPIQKTFSQFLFRKQLGLTATSDFDTEVRRSHFLPSQALYFEQLDRYFTLFPRENIAVYIFEEVFSDVKKFYKSVTDFLGVEEFYPEGLDRKSNITMAPKFQFINTLYCGMKNFVDSRKSLDFSYGILRKTGITPLYEYLMRQNVQTFSSKPQPQDKTIQDLQSFFMPDIEKLENLLGRDLSIWRITSAPGKKD